MGIEVKKVAVVGCGLMGSGIVQTCAQAGLQVTVREVNQEFLDRGLSRIKKGLTRQVEKGKLAKAECDAILARIRGTTELDALAGADLGVEAVIENMEEKRTVFRALDKLLDPKACIVSNTSSLSITELAAQTSRPTRVAGLHFFNPVPVMPLIEIVRGLQTADETVAFLKEFASKLGKQTIVARDNPGFIVNLLLVPYLLGALRALEGGVATAEDIDKGMTLGCNHPMGPLTLLDFVGLDTTLFIADVMFDEYKDPMYAAPPLLRNLVRAGRMGKKSGRGIYEYKESA